jgi:hypothetical protein
LDKQWQITALVSTQVAGLVIKREETETRTYLDREKEGPRLEPVESTSMPMYVFDGVVPQLNLDIFSEIA